MTERLLFFTSPRGRTSPAIGFLSETRCAILIDVNHGRELFRRRKCRCFEDPFVNKYAQSEQIMPRRVTESCTVVDATGFRCKAHPVPVCLHGANR